MAKAEREGLPRKLRVLLASDDDDLETTLVAEPKREMRTEGPPGNGRFPLPDHLIKLQREHAGKPLATLLHAALIVLIRRETALDMAVPRFFALWESHQALLLRDLSLRWLVSAADTLADHGRTPEERLAGFSAALFVNTVKFYETERAVSMSLDPTKADLETQLPQFNLDGIVPFNITRGDTAGNLFRRRDRVLAGPGLGNALLNEVTQRCLHLDTVYSRFRKLYTGKRHAW